MKRTVRRSEFPPIEFSGNARVVVGCCDGILEYEPQTVKLRAAKRTVRLFGENLDLCNLTERTVLIRGTVSSMEFED